MLKTSHVDKVIKKSSTPINFICGKDTNGNDSYYFVMCSKDKLNALRQTSSYIVDVNNYGLVIASGWGNEPSAEVKLMLKEKYGFDADTLK